MFITNSPSFHSIHQGQAGVVKQQRGLWANVRRCRWLGSGWSRVSEAGGKGVRDWEAGASSSSVNTRKIEESCSISRNIN